jgi:hypothetical protein
MRKESWMFAAMAAAIAVLGTGLAAKAPAREAPAAAAYEYKVLSYINKLVQPGTDETLNRMAADGWEPYLVYGEAHESILFRRSKGERPK